jgi:uncharacterized protein (UPF0333 family)
MEKQITSFVLKFVLGAVLVALGAIAAFASSTYVTGTGRGTSQSASEAVGQAVSQATANMYSRCNGSVSNVNVTQSVQSSGGWFYVDASASGYCETR